MAYGYPDGLIMPFKMVVEDVFHLSSGYAVFVGPVEGEVKLISKCACDLYVSGVKHGTIQVVGEDMIGFGNREAAKREWRESKRRAIRALEPVNLDGVSLSKDRCELICGETGETE
jgi:hypothetical protein